MVGASKKKVLGLKNTHLFQKLGLVNVSAKLIASLSERNLPLYPTIYSPRQSLGFIF